MIETVWNIRKKRISALVLFAGAGITSLLQKRSDIVICL